MRGGSDPAPQRHSRLARGLDRAAHRPPDGNRGVRGGVEPPGDGRGGPAGLGGGRAGLAELLLSAEPGREFPAPAAAAA